MSFHVIELTYPEIKYLLAYLQHHQAKQVYLESCLEDNTLERLSKNIAYLQSVEDILIEGIKKIKSEHQEYGSIKFDRN